MRFEHGRRWAIVLLLVAALWFLLWWQRRPIAGPTAGLAASAVTAPASRPAAPDHLVLVPTTPASAPIPAPIRNGPRLVNGVPFYGFCPDNNEPHPPLLHPSFSLPRDTPEQRAIWKDLDEGQAAIHRRDFLSARHAFGAALQKQPHDPILSLYYGLMASHSADIVAAARALADYLVVYPYDINAAQLYARLGTQQEIEAGDETAQSGPVNLRYPSDLPGQKVADAIAAALSDAANWTGTAERSELSAVLYGDRSELLASSCAAAWSGGLFDGTLRLVWQKNKNGFQKVVRHESFHAQLFSVSDRIPSWFNEGAAQYFSGDRVRDHRSAYQLMSNNRTYAPFASLDGSFQAIDEDNSAGLVYEQSLAMVQMLVEARGDGVIKEAGRALASGEAPAGLWKDIAAGADEDDFLKFLARQLSN